MVSLPRDSYVPIPGYGEDKINAAFAFGGAPLLAQTVEQATGIRLDHYAEIGFDGFAELVDAVGGVTMCPAEPISDPLAGIDLPAGCQELDGRTALGYVRTRATPRADLDRMTNQREFMSALMHRAASPAVLLNPLRWYPMAHAASGAVTVDEGAHVWDLARLAWALHGRSPRRRSRSANSPAATRIGRGLGQRRRRPAVRRAGGRRAGPAGRARRGQWLASKLLLPCQPVPLRRSQCLGNPRLN